MIITLIGANFANSNIGTLSSWIISRVLGDGATYAGPSYVDKDAALSATVTLDEGYEIGSAGIIITMGGIALDESCYSVVDNMITFTINSVTGSVMIKVPTLNTNTGEEDEPEIPDTPTNYTFTINPDPTSATVTLSATGYSTVSGTGSKSITVANSTKVNWRVEASGYATRTGSWTISGGNKTENITLSASGGSNYIDITVQGTEKGSIKNSVIKIPDSTSLYLITKVQLPSNATSVEYQAFKTGGSYGSAFVNDAGTVVKFLPKTNVTTGDRVTETVPSGATWFYHMYDDPNNTEQEAPAFTYIRIYTSGESGGGGAEGLPVRITEQTQKNYGLLDAATGVWTVQSYPDEQGGQTVTVCDIPAGATTVNYQMFKTGKTYGSGFFNGSTFISGYANNNDAAGTRKTLSIPAGATEFWHMYPNRTYANGDGKCPEFDYIEFA